MAMPRAYVEEHINGLKNDRTGEVAEFLFNLDELGSTDWEDRKTEQMIVPAAICKDDVYHPVSRMQSRRQATLFACVSASLRPMTL
jgi:hypothetical protein